MSSGKRPPSDMPLADEITKPAVRVPLVRPPPDPIDEARETAKMPSVIVPNVSEIPAPPRRDPRRE